MKEDRARFLARRVRRLPREADGRAGVSRPGGGAAGEAFPVWRRDGRPGDPGRRRPARRTCGCSRRCWRRAATRWSTATSGAEALEQLASASRRPGPARRRDAGDGRLRGLPPAAGRAGHRFLPIVMVTASGDAGESRGARGRRGRLHPQAVRPGRAAGAGAVAATDQGVPRHDLEQAAELAEWNGQLEQRVEQQVERAGTGGPAEAVPVAAARRPDRLVRRRGVPGEPPPRDHGGVLRPARASRRSRRRPSRRTSWPCCGEYHAALGELIHRVRGDARALRRRRADGLLQRPAALPDDAGRAPCAWRWRCASG